MIIGIAGLHFLLAAGFMLKIFHATSTVTKLTPEMSVNSTG